jgi:hypothetical protein
MSGPGLLDKNEKNVHFGDHSWNRPLALTYNPGQGGATRCRTNKLQSVAALGVVLQRDVVGIEAELISFCVSKHDEPVNDIHHPRGHSPSHLVPSYAILI